MTTSSQNIPSDEPIGIVISRGRRDEPSPAFSAYIWGPAPEREAPKSESKAVA